MEFRGNQQNTNASAPRPAQSAPAAAPAGGHVGGSSNMKWEKSPMKSKLAILIVAAIIVIGGLGVWLWKSSKADMAIKSQQYQALFLTNGQVYFGKLSGVGDKYVQLKDIYYLQVQQSVQPADKDKEQPQVSLAKLGSELHGPEDAMHISRDQVLFWENLKDDGKVVKAIKENQNK